MIPFGYVSTLKKVLDECADVALAFGASQHISMSGEEGICYRYSYGAMLSDESPRVRLLALVKFLTDCSLIHGLFRTAVLNESWVAEKCIGVDHVLLSRVAVRARLVYVPETYLIRRDMHASDTTRAQLERITGHPVAFDKTPYATMQHLQFVLGKSLVEGSILTGVPFLVALRYHLIRRFGSLSEQGQVLWLDWVLTTILHLTQSASALSHNTVQHFRRMLHVR